MRMRVTGSVLDSDSIEFLRERFEFLVLLMSSSLRSSKLLVSEELTMELLPSLSSFSEWHFLTLW